MSEISSGLVAVAWIAPTNYEWPAHFISTSEIRNGDPLVRLSDAEAIILDLQNLVTAENQRKQQFEAEVAAKDAEIMEQCRLNGMGAEREATLIGKVAQQSAALKLARQVLMSVKETSSSTRLRRIVDEPLAAIHEVLKGE